MSRLRVVVLDVIAKEATACLCLLERFHVSRSVALSKHIGGFSKCGFSLKLGDSYDEISPKLGGSLVGNHWMLALMLKIYPDIARSSKYQKSN